MDFVAETFTSAKWNDDQMSDHVSAEELVQTWQRGNRIAARRAKLNRAALIYFIRCECPTGFIKIGFAEDPQRRLLGLRTSCPYPLSLIAQLPGSIEEEHAIQKRFAAANVGGEWFRPVPELLEFMATIAPCPPVPT